MNASISHSNPRSFRRAGPMILLPVALLMLLGAVMLAVGCGDETSTSGSEGGTETTMPVTDSTLGVFPAGAWTEVPSSDMWPEPRSGATMVYDPVGDWMIMFGGWDVDTDFGDTWAYSPSDGTWTDLVPGGPAPAPRALYQMAFDPIAGVAVLFGGTSDAGRYGDTWLYDPAANEWSEVAGGDGPEARSAGAMVYVETMGKVVLFGGVSDAGRYDDTWAFDAAERTWTLLEPAGLLPSPRSGHAMAYDSTNEKVVLFGGYDGGSLLDDTWIYDPLTNTWDDVTTFDRAPVSRGNHRMAFDTYTGLTFLFGGSDGTGKLDDIWAYDLATSTWRDATPIGVLPDGREQHTLIYDPGASSLLMFGGFDDSDTELADLWEYALAP